MSLKSISGVVEQLNTYQMRIQKGVEKQAEYAVKDFRAMWQLARAKMDGVKSDNPFLDVRSPTQYPTVSISEEPVSSNTLLRGVALHCFIASLLHYFITSLLHCFIASLLHCFMRPKRPFSACVVGYAFSSFKLT
jgi:hypothetical protein